jgi:hypothetical protein
MRRTHRKDAGFSLAALIFFATAASIVMAAAVPAYKMQAKREMEEELIFRGEEHIRAIQKYQRRFGVYPSSIDQLLSTNGLRFLRKKYVDPVTGKDFRLITVNPDGSLNGSKVFSSNMNNQPLFGNTQIFGQPQGQQGQPGQPQNQQNQQQRGQQPNSQRGFQIAPPQGGQGFTGGFSAPGGFVLPQNQAPRGQQQPQQGRGGPQPSGGFGSPAGGFGAPAGGTPFASGGVIGVASESTEESIKVYNTRQKYEEWEFIAIMGQQQGGGGQRNPQQPGQPQPGQQPNQPGFGPRGNNPFPNTGGAPFGGAPGTSPFGGAPGQPGQPQNPFGFGGTPQPQPQPTLPRK